MVLHSPYYCLYEHLIIVARNESTMARIKPLAKLMHSPHKRISQFGNYLANLLQFRPLLHSMILQDLSGKFKYTVLGLFWHLLNPLTQVVIYYLIFTVIFGKDVPNYWVYIATGMFAYNMMNSCMSGGCSCILGQKNLVTKLSFPREIIVFSKVVVSLVSLIIAYVILTVLMIVSGVGVTEYILLLPIVVVLLTIFCAGMCLLFSSITVYFRDLSNITVIVMGLMVFALPIIYLSSQRYSPMMDLVWHLNPLFYFIETIHDVFYWGIFPNSFNLIMCLLLAPITFVMGLVIFKKLERGFAERL